MTEAQHLASRLTPRERRFILAASARRPKPYATIRRHAKRGDGYRLRKLFVEVRGERGRGYGRYVLNAFGVAVKRAAEGVRHG